jgi:hypothetical protein
VVVNRLERSNCRDVDRLGFSSADVVVSRIFIWLVNAAAIYYASISLWFSYKFFYDSGSWLSGDKYRC